MLIPDFSVRSLVGSWSFEARAPAAALLTAVAASLLARFRRAQMVAPAAAGLGLMVGWSVLAGLSLHPLTLQARLPAVALAATLAQALLGSRARPGLILPSTLVLAALCSWWIAGAPHVTLPDWRGTLTIVVITVWLLAIARLWQAADHWCLIGASVATAASLHAVGAAAVWCIGALVPAAAALGTGVAPAKIAGLLPIRIGIAAAAAAATLAIGRLPHGRLGPVEAACLAVPATLGLGSWIASRFRRPGPASRAFAGLLACAIIVLAAFSAAALAHLR